MNAKTLKQALRDSPVFPVIKRAQDIKPSAMAAKHKRREFYSMFVRPGSLVFDIGANVGNRVETFLSLGARVVAVEPQPACLKVLHARWGRNANLTILPIGVAADSGSARLYIADHHVLSSMSAEYVARTHYKNNQWSDGIQVPVATLASLVDVFGVPAFTKIDVEGFEEEVLRGAGEPLPCLSLELNPQTPEVTANCLNRLGSRYEYAWSGGESMWLDTEWLDADAMAEHVASFDGFGDVYARLC
jgi:FkbM family methyltransferase